MRTVEEATGWLKYACTLTSAATGTRFRVVQIEVKPGYGGALAALSNVTSESKAVVQCLGELIICNSRVSRAHSAA